MIRSALVIARRELGALFHSPIAYVTLTFFLLVEGFSFTAILEILANPTNPAPYGAVLRTHFGGTPLYWTFLFLVICVITMRQIAEEKRLGTWEALITAPVSEATIILGKWLGALAFYMLLWMPTLLYVVILHVFAPEGAAPDLGPVASAYLGVCVSGAAFLALGLAASAVTAHQIVSAIITFGSLISLLLLGLAPTLAAEYLSTRTAMRTVLASIDVQRHMDNFARGIIDARHLVFYASMTTSSLVVAFLVTGLGRWRRAKVKRALLGTSLVVIVSIFGNMLASRHPYSLDTTRARFYSLDSRTRSIIHGVSSPVHALIITGQAEEFSRLYDELDVLLRRFQSEQPLLSIERLDPTRDPARVAAIAVRNALMPRELTEGGAVVLESNQRQVSVALLDMATFSKDPTTGGGILESFRGENALAAALLELSTEDHPRICATNANGELGGERSPEGQDRRALTERLEEDAFRWQEIGDVSGGVPKHCGALAILGPRIPFSADQVLKIDDYLARGGRLLLLEESTVGLESVLAGYGIRPSLETVVDSESRIGDAGGWITVWGYGEHPISNAFRGRRLTIWLAPRRIEIMAVPSVRTTALVMPGGNSADRSRPVAVAAEREANGSRVVVIGSANSFTSDILDKGLGANDALLVASMSWLTGRAHTIGIAAKTPEQFRVVLTGKQVEKVYYMCVIVMPLAAMVLGCILMWRRVSQSRARR